MRISVVISTCNRPKLLKSAIESVLANNYPDFDLVIVDQSENNDTRNLVEEYIKYDSRVRYIHCPGKGSGKSKNVGIKEAKGSIVATTDDDCVVAQDWVEKIASFFDTHPDTVVIFGDVIPGKPSPSGVLCPWYNSANRKYVGVFSMMDIVGLGANMAIRREVFERVGDFDENIGAGAPIGSGEDTDLAYRTLAMGYTIRDTNTVKVQHYGWRDLQETIKLIRRYRRDLGTFFTKYLRCGDFGALIVLIGITWKTTYFTLFRGLTKPANRILIQLPNSFSDRLLFFIIWICHPFIDIVSGIFKAFQFSVDKNKKVFIKK